MIKFEMYGNYYTIVKADPVITTVSLLLDMYIKY